MNSKQLIDNDEALRLFFNDDIYFVGPMANDVKHMATVNNVATPPANNLQQTTEQNLSTTSKLEEPTTNYKSTTNFSFLGKNEKSILILVNDAENAVSTAEGRELLRKLVLSIHLKNADFALVNYANYATAGYDELHSFFGCKLLLSFGVTTAALGLPQQLLHQLNVVNNVKMIFTYNLHELDSNVAAKKSLWSTLKNL